jgi:hypothetical protein
MEIECSLEPLTNENLKELYNGSIQRLREYFVQVQGAKWENSGLRTIVSNIRMSCCLGEFLLAGFCRQI